MNKKLHLRRNRGLVLLLVTFMMVENVGFNAIISFKKPSSRSGLVAYWPGNGNTKDAVGGHNGIPENNVAYSPGVSGEAFEFDGVGAYVKIQRSSSLNVKKQITIEFWMKAGPDNPMDSYQGLVSSDFFGVEISNGFQSTVGVNFYVSSNKGVSWGATSEANGGGAIVSADEWHHIAGTYDGTKLQLYIDGQPWGSPDFYSGNISPESFRGFLAIGSEDGRVNFPNCIGTRYFNGLIDEVRIYNRALSAQEVETHFLAGQ